MSVCVLVYSVLFVVWATRARPSWIGNHQIGYVFVCLCVVFYVCICGQDYMFSVVLYARPLNAACLLLSPLGECCSASRRFVHSLRRCAESVGETWPPSAVFAGCCRKRQRPTADAYIVPTSYPLSGGSITYWAPLCVKFYFLCDVCGVCQAFCM